MTKLSSLIRNEHLKLIEKSRTAKTRAILESVDSVVKEELKIIMNEAKENAPKIESKLEDLRKSLIKDGKISLTEKGGATNNRAALPVARIPLHTVSELVDIPINELMLYFLGGHRVHEGRELIEYGLGCVSFYGVPKMSKIRDGE